MMKKQMEYQQPADILVSINVTNLKKAEKFWVEDLGFKRGWDKGLDDGWLEIDTPVKGFIIGLNLVKEEELERNNSRINIAVKNVESAKEYLEKRGIKVTKIKTIPRVLKILTTFDPDKNPISFVEGLDKYRF